MREFGAGGAPGPAGPDDPLLPGQAAPPKPQWVAGQVWPSTSQGVAAEAARKASALKEWYSLKAHDGGPRALRWEEARVGFVPLGATVRGVVEEVRPYGAFIGFILNTTSSFTSSEDSRVRGLCRTEHMALPEVHGVGTQLAVKVTDVDHKRQRIFVSALEAEPQWFKLPGMTAGWLPPAPTAPDRTPSDEEAEMLLGRL